MLFKKRHSVSTKIAFSLNHRQNDWEVYLTKPPAAKMSPALYFPKPDIIVSYKEETDLEYSAIVIHSAAVSVVMKATRFSDETKVLGEKLQGYDSHNRKVIEYHEDENSIYVALGGMNHFFEAEHFAYCCSHDSMTFQNNKQVVMEMNPVFRVGCPGEMQIRGWIYESYLDYLPYLSGLLGYVHLT